MGRVDQWWNEHFPPYSWARLGFAIAFIPVSSLLWWVMAEDVITWGRYLAITLMTQAFFAVMYVMARNRRDEIGDLEKAGLQPWPAPRRPLVPVEPKERSDAEKELLLASSLHPRPKKPRISRGLDVGLSFAISFVTFTAMLFIFVPDTPELYGVGLAAATALLFSLALVFRYSIVFIVGFSILLGYPLAEIARALYSVMSFFSDPGPLLLWWPLTSVGIFSFLAPGWFAVRRHRRALEYLRIPNWVTTSFVCVFLLVSMAIVTAESDDVVPASQPAPAAPVSGEGPSGVPTFGVGSADEAMIRLFFAWRNGDRAAAQQVALPEVVRELLGTAFDASARTLGCGIGPGGYDVCVIRRSTDLVVLTPGTTNDGRAFIQSYEFAPLDHPVDYSRPEATATVAGP